MNRHLVEAEAIALAALDDRDKFREACSQAARNVWALAGSSKQPRKLAILGRIHELLEAGAGRGGVCGNNP